MTRDLRALLVYLLICFLTFTVAALAIELMIRPVIAWLQGYNSYYLPTLSRVYAWIKFVPLAALICAVGAWWYDRRRLGQ